MIKDVIGTVLILLLIIALARSVGKFMARVYSREKNFLDFFAPIERWIFRICGIAPQAEMDLRQYLWALLVTNSIWLIWGFTLLIIQGRLFLNPAHNASMEWSLALNSGVSFLTSTNLQHYSGETGATYFSQIAVFTYLQFVSAATSLAVGVAVVRGLLARSTRSLGNFYYDFVVSCTRVLFPLCVMTAIIFMLNGMPMTFRGPDHIIGLQGDSITVATGPVAAMVPIKELGSNGGGYFGANDAHPLENPNFITFITHSIIVFLLPMAFVFFIGDFLNNRRFGRILFGVMLAGFLAVAIPIIAQECRGNPEIGSMAIQQPAGNLEGKEMRMGSFYTAYYCGENVVIPAGTPAGMHDSFMPLSGVFMIVAMQIDAFFGGLGTGWINMFIYLILALFIGTLMVGRTPEIFGKKIGMREMQAAVLTSIFPIVIPLALAGLASFVYIAYSGPDDKLGWLSNKGYHGFTTMLYEFISSYAGNGSEFSGLGNNTRFWNLSTSAAMLAGRFIPIVGALYIASRLSNTRYAPPSSGTLRTDSVSFGIFLLMMILILSALSLFPALMIGPISEHYSIFK